jgi:hypothetical protein
MWNWFRRSVALLAIGILVIVIAWFAYGHFYDLRLEHQFHRVASGMDEQQVLSVMGKPDTVGKCGKLGGFPNGCDHEYLYDEMLPTITTWAVFFDAQGRVIDKYEYQSP